MEHLAQCKREILSFGATDVRVAAVKDIQFDSKIRMKCNPKTCELYGKKWTCPPSIEAVDILIEDLKEYNHIIIFRKVYSLEKMSKQKSKEQFWQMTNKIMHSLSITNPPARLLIGGGCHICKVCSGQTNTPCRFPSIAYAALEAYAIDNAELSRLSGLEANDKENDEKTAIYLGAVFLW